MNIPGFSLRRAYLIARRDFLGYVRTWGFWLTTFGPLIMIGLIFLAPVVMSKSEPTRYATILDETGIHGAAIENLARTENDRVMESAIREFSKFAVKTEDRDAFEKIISEQGTDAAIAYIRKENPSIIGRYLKLPQNKLQFAAPPASNIEDIKPYVLGDKLINMDGKQVKLYGALHIYEEDGEIKTDFWTTSVVSNSFVNLANRYFSRLSVDKYLDSAGLSRDALKVAETKAPNVISYNPAKLETGVGGQALTFEDTFPYLVAGMLSMLLWLTIFTGAYMLLVSMVEEKINKVLEMLLASTRFSEIFVGKLVGVGALTLASLSPWILLGVFGLFGAAQLGDSAVINGLAIALDQKMMIFLPIFLVLGFVFYGSIFIALGSLAESMQDASTLMTPMMLLMTACILIVPLGMSTPDSPILFAAQWFPFSAPFAAIVRLPADPPLWQTLGSIFSLVFTTVVIVWLWSRMFQHGVLTGGGIASVKDWFARTILRKKPSK
jgi:ABC-2 type transport system permease protein